MPRSPTVVRTVPALRRALDGLRVRKATTALVPTMGALHDGHVSLVRLAQRRATRVIVSIFVNPTQFAPNEDLAKYPRTFEEDCAKLAAHDVHVVFHPDESEMYPQPQVFAVDPPPIANKLEGRFRPGHFRGVATVCVKLFNIVRPDRVYFGQKDAQQVEVIRRLLADLALEVELRVVPTVRDPDGLALSSRNLRLSPEERQRALALPRALNTRNPARARALLTEEGLDVDYIEVAPFHPPVLAGAVRLGGIRLIDNVTLEGDET
jgi:pantoate--beta-alanine ligase